MDDFDKLTDKLVIMKKIFFITVLLINSICYSQIFGNDPEIKINNLNPDNTWQIIEMALLENNMNVGEFKPSEGLLVSDWITWTSVMINNRARLYFSQNETTITLRIGDRTYKSDEGWSESIGNLSKKNYKKYVQDIADKINEINSNPNLIKKAIKTSKLIPAFNPINVIESVEWKLITAIQTEQNRPILTFKITNKGNKAITLTSLGGEFENMGGVGTARFGAKWEKPDVDNYRKTTLNPLEEMEVIIEVGQGYHLISAQGYVMTFRYEYFDGAIKKETLNIYNIPIPYSFDINDI